MIINIIKFFKKSKRVYTVSFGFLLGVTFCVKLGFKIRKEDYPVIARVFNLLKNYNDK